MKNSIIAFFLGLFGALFFWRKKDEKIEMVNDFSKLPNDAKLRILRNTISAKG